MKKRRNQVFLAGIVVIIVIIFIIFYFYERISIDDKNSIKIIQSDSQFDEFYIEENKVFVKCEVTIQNRGDKDKYINLLANMEEDKNNGLLKSAIIFGYDKKGNNEFIIPANSQKDYEVFFIGDFGGTAVKQNRNLPIIEAVVL